MKKVYTLLTAFAALLIPACLTLPADAPPSGSAPSIKGLPVIEIPSPAPAGDSFAIVLSGDGGWAGLDRKIAELLSAEHGISVVGFNCLSYFLSRRTPEGAAGDVERILRHYSAVWAKSRIILIGYSFGADVLPFITSRLPEDLRSVVQVAAFISLGSSIDFKFGLHDWFGGKPKPDAMATVPEMQKLKGMRILCFYGLDDKDKTCASGELDFVTAIPLQGGHGIHGDGEDVVAEIMKTLE